MATTYATAKLIVKAGNSIRAINGSSESKLASNLSEIKEEWLALPRHDIQDIDHTVQARWDRHHVGSALKSGLFLPNGYVASLEVQERKGSREVLGVSIGYTSLRNTFGEPLAVDPIDQDCQSIGFAAYPWMGAYKAFLAYAHSTRSEIQAELDFYDWSKELTGEYLSGGSSYHATPGKIRCIGATGMMHSVTTMARLTREPILTEHFNSESLVSFRGSGGADHTMARYLAPPLGQGLMSTVPELAEGYTGQLERGISIN